MSFENRNYMIFNTSELHLINFEEVLQTSAETVRPSTDGTKTFVKWEGETTPACISSLSWTDGPYTHAQMLALMQTPEWNGEQPTP